jgi:hypothetical protein
MYSNEQTEVRFQAFQRWSWTRQSSGLPYLRSDDVESFEKLDPIAQQYGAETLSAWDRAAAELGIKLRKPAPQPAEIDDAFRREIAQMPSSELLKRINRDPVFRQKFDVLSTESAAAQAAGSPEAEPEVTLTRQDYYSIPAAVIAKRYAASPAFRRAVDVLISRGEI